MDHQLTLLAHQSDRRFIVRCRQGMLHLNWDTITIHLHPIDFLRMAYLLDETCAHPDQCLFAAGSLCVTCHKQRHCQLWFGSSGVQLNPVDLSQLQALVQMVLTAYARESVVDDPVAPAAIPGLSAHQVSQAAPGFSYN